MEKRYYKLSEAAKILGVDDRTIKNGASLVI